MKKATITSLTISLSLFSMAYGANTMVVKNNTPWKVLLKVSYSLQCKEDAPEDTKESLAEIPLDPGQAVDVLASPNTSSSTCSTALKSMRVTAFVDTNASITESFSLENVDKSQVTISTSNKSYSPPANLLYVK